MRAEARANLAARRRDSHAADRRRPRRGSFRRRGPVSFSLREVDAVSFRFTISGAVYCRRHRAYNPQAGQAGIKGGCVACYTLLELFQRFQQLGGDVANFKEGQRERKNAC